MNLAFGLILLLTTFIVEVSGCVVGYVVVVGVVVTVVGAVTMSVPHEEINGWGYVYGA